VARGRFISKTISENEELAQVSLEAALLFTWCIPHLDREGRMSGNPDLIKATACPLRPEIDSGSIPDLLRTLGGVGLVHWYEVDGRQVLFFPKFHDHNKGLKYDREAASRYPDWCSESGTDLLRTNSGPTPDQVRTNSPVREVKGREEKVAADAAPKAASWSHEACEVWREVAGGTPPGGRIGKALKPLVAEHGKRQVLAVWERYLAEHRDEGRLEFANPQDFAAKYGYYAGNGAQKSESPFPDDPTVNAHLIREALRKEA
jgi:hypothetical protein